MEFRDWVQVKLKKKTLYSIASVRTLTGEDIEFGNFILIAAIHY